LSPKIHDRGKSRTPGAEDREHPVRAAENTRHGKRRPRTPGAGDREHPVRVAENTRYGNRRPRTPGQGSREHPVWSRKPRTPGVRNREHPVREAENTWHRKSRIPGLEQEAENARRRKPDQGSRELPALVRVLRTSGARTRVPFGRRGALFIPAFREVFSPILR